MKQAGDILVIDDDFTSRYLVQSLLTTLGVSGQILTARNGHEALTLLKQRSSAGYFTKLVLLDLVMPGSDGFAFLDGLAELEQTNLLGTKIAILSYYGSRLYRERASLYPINAYFQKPLTAEKLHEVLEF